MSDPDAFVFGLCRHCGRVGLLIESRVGPACYNAPRCVERRTRIEDQRLRYERRVIWSWGR